MSRCCLQTLRRGMMASVIEELFLARMVDAAQRGSITISNGRRWAYLALSFWVVALLLASEHGPYWDVGLVAGIIFNWWMIRTKSLGDLILRMRWRMPV